MKKAISIFSTFLCLFTFGQKDKDYSLYHYIILKIEECNSRGSFDSSIAMYSDIFNKYDRVLARDAYNACQIAALQNNKHFSDFFFFCAKSGITKTKLLSNRLIKSKFTTDSVKLNTLFSKGSKDYFKRIDTTLRQEMIQRSDNEQKNKGKEKYFEICKDNFNRILDLSKQDKFPGENIIGNSDEVESLIFPTLCHYPYSFRIMEPFLIDALNTGKVTPLSLIYLYGFNQTRKSILYTNDIPVDTINFKIAYNMPYGMQSTDFTEVNKQRTIKKIFSMSIQNNLRGLNSKHGLDYKIGYY